MKKEFKKIWDIALPFQDKRNDKDHASIVMKFAMKLLRSEKGDEDIVIPAAILHDIGWSQILEKERMTLFDCMPDSKKERILKIKHQKEGVRLAKKLLKEVKYDPKLTKEILEIISEHDTRKSILNMNDSILRDADKLWMFSKKGFEADIRRRKISVKKWNHFLLTVIDQKLNTDTAKKIAKQELEKRIIDYAQLHLF